MAGGLSKTVGALLLVFGLLIVLAGGAGLYYGDQEHEQAQSGLLPDDQKKEESEQIMIASAVAIGVGVIGILVGTIALLIGGARARGEMLRAMEDRPMAPPAISPVPLPAATTSAESPAPSRGPVVAVSLIGAALLIGLVFGVASLFTGGGVPGFGNGGNDDGLANRLALYANATDLDAIPGAETFRLARGASGGSVDDYAVGTSAVRSWNLDAGVTLPLRVAGSSAFEVTWTYTVALGGELSFAVTLKTDSGAFGSEIVQRTVANGDAVTFMARVPTNASFETRALTLEAHLSSATPMGSVSQDLEASRLDVPVRA